MDEQSDSRVFTSNVHVPKEFQLKWIYFYNCHLFHLIQAHRINHKEIVCLGFDICVKLHASKKRPTKCLY